MKPTAPVAAQHCSPTFRLIDFFDSWARRDRRREIQNHVRTVEFDIKTRVLHMLNAKKEWFGYVEAQNTRLDLTQYVLVV